MDQTDLFDTEATRSLLDHLLAESQLYRTSQDYKDLLDFVVRLRNFAPFNAMLLQLQKPGLRFAASGRDWREKFGRTVREKSRPLLILWPFGPVALVYDVVDTEGQSLPEDVAAFTARGDVAEAQIADIWERVEARGIECRQNDAGDTQAGSIRVVNRASSDLETTQYRIHINRNHKPPVQFASIAHELGHLFLGHLGKDSKKKIPLRPTLTLAMKELEAESVSYIVCSRNSVDSKAKTYLANYVDRNTTIDGLDIYLILRAAGQVETTMGIAAHTRFTKLER
jgi:hypothetical protein